MTDASTATAVETSDDLDLFDAFATDTKAEQEGIWTPIPGAGKRKFKVARVGSVAYGKLLQRLYKANRAVLDSDTPAAKTKSDAIMAEVYASTVLLGWEGNIMFKGVATPYSKEAAMALLMLPEFRIKVQAVAEDYNTFLAKKEEEDAKN